MISGTIPVKEYEDISKDHVFKQGWNNHDWKELKLYATLLKRRSSELGIEDPIKDEETRINLGSYFGKYILTNPNKGINVISKHFSREEINQIVDEIIQWCARLGPNIFTQLRSYLPIDKHEYILSFSIMLRELTEQILSSYITPLIEKENIISPSVMGSINIPQTSRNLLQGKPLIVNSRVKMNFLSLPIHLLIRFNYEMICALEHFLVTLESWIDGERDADIILPLEKMAKTNIFFHSYILTQRRFRFLIDTALNINFEDSTILEQTIQQASSNESLKDMVYLWEAFKGGRSLLPQLNHIMIGGFTLKPLSKLFELWILKQLVTNLSKFTSSSCTCEPGVKGSMTFTYENTEPQLSLFFNPYSTKSFERFNKFPWIFRPDFIITLKNSEQIYRGILIADAKYKESPDGSDVQRMMAYLLAFGWKDEKTCLNGLFIHVADRTGSDIQFQETTRESPNVTLTSLSIRPGLKLKFEEELEKILIPLLIHS